MSVVTPADDRLHPPAEAHPLWSETAWFGFSVPERSLAGTIYPLFRPNLGICSLSVYVWDASGHEPWRLRYGRGQWHLAMPEGDLDDLALGGLALRCIEPLTRYGVRYEDADQLALDLEYTGLIPPHAFGIDAGRGHIDQPCRVTGMLRLRGEAIAVDGYDMRDRSWHVRDDHRTTRASYSYAIASERDMFLAGGFWQADHFLIVAGFLVRDGEKADLVSGSRRILESDGPYPTRVAVQAEDRLGRRLHAEGRCASRLAYQATPGMFAWLSLTDWGFDGQRGWGADQDVWSPDLLGG